jgi:hypothetical protein
MPGTSNQAGPMPRYARKARFDQGSKRVSCTKDTRTEILDAIHHWFSGQHTEKDHILSMKGSVDGRIFWLDGIAGTGKSTIAQTIANRLIDTGELGASFFCSRDDAECSDVNLIFPTIACQLSLINPSFGTYVSKAICEDPDVQYALPLRQLKKLIVEPLQVDVCRSTFRPCIVIIDALDECKDEDTISTALSALADAADRIFPLKFFITSRPVMNVVQGFLDTGLMKDTSKLILHNIPSDISHGDIHVYLENRLARTARFFSLPLPWPPSEELAK